MLRDVRYKRIGRETSIFRPDPDRYFVVQDRIGNWKHKLSSEYGILTFGGIRSKDATIDSNWHKGEYCFVCAQRQILSLLHNHWKLIALLNNTWTIDLDDSLRSLDILYPPRYRLFVLFVATVLLDIILVGSMNRWPLIWPNNKARDQQVALSHIRRRGIKDADPGLIKLVIETPVQRAEAYAILSNDFISENSIVIVEFYDHFEGFQFILVHMQPIERQTLVPNSRILLVLLLGLLHLIGTFDFQEWIRRSLTVLALDISPFEYSNTYKIFLPFEQVSTHFSKLI